MFTCFAQVYWLRLERRHQVWVVRNIVQVQQHRTVDQNQFTTEGKNKTVEHMSSLLDGSIWAVTPNLENSTGATNAELNKINKKTIDSPPYGPYIAERNPTANSQLQIPKMFRTVWLRKWWKNKANWVSKILLRIVLMVSIIHMANCFPPHHELLCVFSHLRFYKIGFT